MDVEIWSDIACPWCYIGKRRFEAALSVFEHADAVKVHWRSFELDPAAPLERTGDRAAHLAEKYGITLDRAQEIERHLAEVAATDGLDFHFETARAGTTFDAHRLIHLAAAHGLQDAMKERLLRAYFTEGQLVGDRQTLLRLASEVGVPADEAEEMLAGQRYVDEVRADERTAGALGITAVPTFVIDRATGASGAHPPESLLKLLRAAWANRSPLQVAAGQACAVDGC